MIAYRKEHKVISRKLSDAVCGMEPLRTHSADGSDGQVPRDAMTFSVTFAGYDKEKGADDLVCIVINTYWEDVSVNLPNHLGRIAWRLSVNTYGDENGNYCYPEGSEVRIESQFTMRPRSVAVFTGRAY